MAEAGPLLGKTLRVTVGAPAQGGACVARHQGRVVFVRHALPGEVVNAVVTEDRGGSFCRADAVEVLTASPDRVPPPCPSAGPGRCGGCDWQHASAAAQLAIKRDVVCEQFRRLAQLDVQPLLPAVEALPGGLLGTRTRITYAVDGDGALGLHRHRSTQIEPLVCCPAGVPGVGDADVLTRAARYARAATGVTGVEVAAGDEGTAVLTHRPGPGRQARGRRPPDRVDLADGPATLRHHVVGRDFTVSAGGFWQGHPAAAEVLTRAVLDAAAARPGERVVELYAGAGLFTAALADAVGPVGHVLGLEADRVAVADATANLVELPWAEVARGRVDPDSVTAFDRADVVVLDPPRAGTGREVMAAMLGLGARAVVYVSCDPATLARDVRIALDAGWTLSQLRAFDAFPMTHHVECLALLVPPAGATTD